MKPEVRSADVQPVDNETRDRIVTAIVTILPFIGVGIIAWQSAKSGIQWYDVAAFVFLYAATGLGVTVGFHRYFTHRSFSTTRPVRAALAIIGSAAIEGPVISWVADHRKHHAFSDKEGDPHSPHVGHGGGIRGALTGLAHAHVGWLFIHTQRGAKRRYAPDLMADPVVSFVDANGLHLFDLQRKKAVKQPPVPVAWPPGGATWPGGSAPASFTSSRPGCWPSVPPEWNLTKSN